MVENVGANKSKCGCLSRTTFWLPCACELVKTIKAVKPISLDVIHIHWKRLSLDDANVIKEDRLKSYPFIQHPQLK
jgi:hypothetical protein